MMTEPPCPPAPFASGVRAVTSSSCGQRLLGHDQRVIARAGERRRQSGEDCLCRRDRPCWSCRASGCWARTTWPPKASPMAWWPRQTPRIGVLPAMWRISGTRMPGLARRARSRRQQNALGLQRLDLFHRQLVVAADLDLGAQLAQVLDKVVGERIVVVEDKDHG